VRQPVSHKHTVTKKIQAPEKQGILAVCYRDGRHPVWESRWVVLKNNFLYIFLSDTDLEAEAIFWSRKFQVAVKPADGGTDGTAFTVGCAARDVYFKNYKGPAAAASWREALAASTTASSSDIRDLTKADPPTWVPDVDAEQCFKCEVPFGIYHRQHHCRLCGLIFCRKCCDTKEHLPHIEARVKLCDDCVGLARRPISSAARPVM